MLTNNQATLSRAVLLHGVDILAKCQSNPNDIADYLDRVIEERLNYPIPKESVDPAHWFIPNEYYPNLVEFLYGSCTTDEQRDRVSQELELFISNKMYDVLHVMKYIVDTLRANNIVWGVGRGSSVASYVLHLIGVHKIDSIKYNIPIEEFFKGETNG
jgi:DNA polymerase III alpha subunit